MNLFKINLKNELIKNSFDCSEVGADFFSRAFIKK